MVECPPGEEIGSIYKRLHPFSEVYDICDSCDNVNLNVVKTSFLHEGLCQKFKLKVCIIARQITVKILLIYNHI